MTDDSAKHTDDTRGTDLTRRRLFVGSGLLVAAGVPTMMNGVVAQAQSAVPADGTARSAPGAPARTLPRTIGHVGLTVPDLDAAVAWYGDVLGFRPIAPALTIRKGDGVQGEISADMFGPEFEGFRIVHLSTGGNTALELFQFLGPAFVEREREYMPWRGGYSHLCVVDPNVDELVARIEAAGGLCRTRIWTMFEAKPDPYRVCIAQDSWGSIIEIYSHGSEQSFANQGRM